MSRYGIELKLGNMRKPEEFVVYPAGDRPEIVKLQGDHRCLVLDTEMRQGLLSAYQKGHPGFHACQPAAGAMPVQVTEDVMKQILAKRPQSGDRIGGVMVIA